MLTALAVTGVSSLGAHCMFAAPAPAAPTPGLLPAARDQLSRKTLDYFTRTALQLLRPPQGILSQANIAPSLPGMQYSTTLWDWDTLWTTKGLFRYADLTHDDGLRGGGAANSDAHFRAGYRSARLPKTGGRTEPQESGETDLQSFDAARAVVTHGGVHPGSCRKPTGSPA